MRLLGIDYGTKRVGIALTNLDGTMAFPYATYAHDESLVTKIVALCEEKEVGGVVIGQSYDLDGAPNRVQKGIDALVGTLQSRQGAPVHLEPEQFSTQAALRIQGRTEKTDASAAALILGGYLARQSAAADTSPSHTPL